MALIDLKLADMTRANYGRLSTTGADAIASRKHRE